MPAEVGEAAHIQEFSGSAIGSGGVPLDGAGKAAGLRHRPSQLGDGEVQAAAHIDEGEGTEVRACGAAGAGGIGTGWIPVLQGKDTGLDEVVGMEEFAQWRARTPAGDAGAGAVVGPLGGLVEAADQGRHHVAVFGVVVVAGPVEVGGHQADGIKAVLSSQRLTQLDASDLGDYIPLVRGLQLLAEQRFLADWLLSELGVDAAAA